MKMASQQHVKLQNLSATHLHRYNHRHLWSICVLPLLSFRSINNATQYTINVCKIFILYMMMEDLLLLKNVFFRGDHVDNLANYICTLVYLRHAYTYIWIQSLLWLSEIISNYWALSVRNKCITRVARDAISARPYFNRYKKLKSAYHFLIYI